MKVVVTSHGDFCTGILNSLEMIVGKNGNVFVIKLSESGIGSFTEKLNSLLDELTKQNKVLILCDLKGGTPYNQSFQYFLANQDKVRVVSGLNLPMLIETSMMMGSIEDLDTLADMAVQAGQTGVDKPSADDSDEDNLEF
ncbi:PTS sugar transporter subunit IIA [Cytobacillus sp. Hz8]|uniref:PTS sugar transporter subunit IIA n=1 Tax=Cytobacillus sp. Hz8 TaxID=3347168 RepID=UPI0035E22F13